MSNAASSAPAWVSYAALGISGLAATFTGLNANNSRRALKAGGPVVTVEVISLEPTYYRKPDGEIWHSEVETRIRVINEGRGPVDIEHLVLDTHFEKGGTIAREVLSDYFGERDKTTFPYRMEGNQSHTWTVDILSTLIGWRDYIEGMGRATHFQVGVRLGNGSVVTGGPIHDMRQVIERANGAAGGTEIK